MRLPLAVAFAFLAAGCPSTAGVECRDDTSCDLSGGGVCAEAPSGSQWCAYPDPQCPGGLRFSDFHTGDGLAGTCVAPATDAGVDAPDTPPGTWSAPVPLALNDPMEPEGGARLSPDGRELYFWANQPGSHFVADVYYVTRAGTSFAWPAARMSVGAVNTSVSEAVGSIAPDGLSMYLGRVGVGLMVSTRATLASAWGPPMALGIDGSGPNVLADGLTMYYVGDPSTCPSALCRVRITRRDAASPWGNPVVEEINVGPGYQIVDIASDGLKALLTGPPNVGVAPIAISARPDRTAPWGPPVPIAELAAYSGINNASWSPDGREIYLGFFTGNQDLYVSQLR